MKNKNVVYVLLFLSIFIFSSCKTKNIPPQGIDFVYGFEEENQIVSISASDSKVFIASSENILSYDITTGAVDNLYEFENENILSFVQTDNNKYYCFNDSTKSIDIFSSQFEKESIIPIDFEYEIDSVINMILTDNFIVVLYIDKNNETSIITINKKDFSVNDFKSETFQSVINICSYKKDLFIMGEMKNLSNPCFKIYDAAKNALKEEKTLTSNDIFYGFSYNEEDGSLYIYPQDCILKVSFESDFISTARFINTESVLRFMNITYNTAIYFDPSMNNLVGFSLTGSDAVNRREEEHTDTQTEINETTANNSEKTITVALPSIDYNDPVDNTLKESIQKFIRETGINVNVSTYSDAYKFNLKLLANETDFDVFVTSDLNVFRNGAFLDLSGDKEINAIFDKMYSGIKELFTINGQLFGVPQRISYDVYRVITEKDEDINISDDWTYDDVYAVADRLKEKGKYFTFGDAGANQSYRPSFWSYAYTFSDSEKRIFKNDSGALKTYIELHKKMNDNNMIKITSVNDRIDYEHNTEVYFDTQSILSSVTINEDNLYPVPKFTKEDLYPVEIYSYCINKYTKNAEEAKKLLIYLADEEILAGSQRLPVYTSLYKNWDTGGYTEKELTLFERNKNLHENILKNSKRQDSNLDFIMYCIEQYVLYDQGRQLLEDTYDNIMKKGKLIFQE